MSGAGIEVAGLTVAYHGVEALTDVDLRLGAGTVCGLVGMNGSGKSTLFKAIMGFVRVQRGRVRVAGLPPRAVQKRGLVAYVPQAEEVDWAFPVSVEDVVMMGRYGFMGPLRIPRAADRAAVAEALGRTGMAALAGRQIGELSGGQRKRAFLARALAQQATVLLLDEPFAGVDVTTQAMIGDLLAELRDDGGTILVSTHDLPSVGELANEVVLLNRRVIAHGDPAGVMTEEHLAQTFGQRLIRIPGTAHGVIV